MSQADMQTASVEELWASVVSTHDALAASRARLIAAGVNDLPPLPTRPSSSPRSLRTGSTREDVSVSSRDSSPRTAGPGYGGDSARGSDREHTTAAPGSDSDGAGGVSASADANMEILARKQAEAFEATYGTGAGGGEDPGGELPAPSYFPSRDAKPHVVLAGPREARSWPFVKGAGLPVGGSSSVPHFGVIVNASGRGGAPCFFQGHDLRYVVACDDLGSNAEGAGPSSDESVAAQLDELAQVIERSLKGGSNVLVHDNVGCCRGAAVVAGWMLRSRLFDLEEAREVLLSQRPDLQLSPVLDRALRDYAAKLQGKPGERETDSSSSTTGAADASVVAAAPAEGQGGEQPSAVPVLALSGDGAAASQARGNDDEGNGPDSTQEAQSWNLGGVSDDSSSVSSSSSSEASAPIGVERPDSSDDDVVVEVGHFDESPPKTTEASVAPSGVAGAGSSARPSVPTLTLSAAQTSQSEEGHVAPSADISETPVASSGEGERAVVLRRVTLETVPFGLLIRPRQSGGAAGGRARGGDAESADTFVQAVAEGNAAHEAGVKVGDVLVKVGNSPAGGDFASTRDRVKELEDQVRRGGPAATFVFARESSATATLVPSGEEPAGVNTAPRTPEPTSAEVGGSLARRSSALASMSTELELDSEDSSDDSVPSAGGEGTDDTDDDDDIASVLMEGEGSPRAAEVVAAATAPSPERSRRADEAVAKAVGSPEVVEILTRDEKAVADVAIALNFTAPSGEDARAAAPAAADPKNADVAPAEDEGQSEEGGDTSDFSDFSDGGLALPDESGRPAPQATAASAAEVESPTRTSPEPESGGGAGAATTDWMVGGDEDDESSDDSDSSGPEWVECWDDKKGKAYYFNRLTEESRWMPPDEPYEALER